MCENMGGETLKITPVPQIMPIIMKYNARFDSDIYLVYLITRIIALSPRYICISP